MSAKTLDTPVPEQQKEIHQATAEGADNDSVTPMPLESGEIKVSNPASINPPKDIPSKIDSPIDLSSNKSPVSQAEPPEKKEISSRIAPSPTKEDITWNEPASTQTKNTPNIATKAASLVKESTDLAKITPAAPAEATAINKLTTYAEKKTETETDDSIALASNDNAAKSAETLAPVNNTLQETRIWEGKKGNSLKKILTAWCENSKIELVWNSKESYDLSQNVIISGTLETALNVTFSQALKNPPSFKITNDGLPKLIIE